MTQMQKAFTLAEGRLAWQTKSGGQVRSYTSKVSEVSTVSEVSKMSKQGGQQSLHSFAPWGEGQDEGSYKLDATGMTPHQVRTKLAKRSLKM